MSEPKQSWEIEQQRLTLFQFPGLEVDAESLWSLLTDTPPETVNRKPTIGTTQIEGSFGKGRLLLSVNPQRIDFIYSPTTNLAEPVSSIEFATLGTQDEVGEIFIDTIKAWLPNCPKIFRLAYGCILIRRTSNKLESYQVLNSLLPSVDIDVADSTDLIYTINRPRQSKVIPGLKLNRYSKWNALTLFVSLESQGATAARIPASEAHACRLELDLNTDAERTIELPSEHLAAIVDELNDLANEIAIYGDVK